MQLSSSMLMFATTQKILVFLCVLNSSFGRKYEEIYPEAFYDSQAQQNKVKIALEKLEHAPEWVPNWPDTSVKMGQVSGVAIDNSGNLVVFHRALHVWDRNSFTDRNVYRLIGDPPIPHPTILVFNETGDLIDTWGQNLFWMPHGITVDKDGNVWVTDVAMHQVFKFTPDQRTVPALTLGEKFVPRDDDTHFCKPSAVAVLSTGDFFVADGYCNSRIIKYAADGSKLLQWGRRTGDTPYTFLIPHALTLAEDRGLVCVADRERGRVACFRHDNGTYASGYSSWLVGPRVFSVAYSPVHGGRLYLVNGYANPDTRVRGYVIDMTSGRLIQTFAPPDRDFSQPHDIVASADGSRVYVAEISPYTVHKFVEEGLRVEGERKVNVPTPVKPTATNIEVTNTTTSSGGAEWGAWGGAWGGAAGAAGAALLAGAAVALLSARNKGRKSVPRRRWEYGGGEFKLRRLLSRRGGRFMRVQSDDSEDEPAPMLPPPPAHPANA